ncbi:DUF1592 domain-containing protein [Planctomicrobium sp. SH661]|uniref:DUF1592 domain-containing protein n=1 Tax=Planctomicrobium sp. SH661 TaxID=3448124 RepID=UPI003F5C3AB8
MNASASTFRLTACLVVLIQSVAAAGTPQENFESVKPLLIQFCGKCHSAEKSEGGLDLTRFETYEQAHADRKIWDTVQSRVVPKEMPPEGSPQPSEDERWRMMVWLEEIVKEEGACNQIANDGNTNFYRGHVMSRRLTRTEYVNSIRDLTGVQVDAAQELPSDGSGGEGFDAVGDSLFLSPIHLERYLDTAEGVTFALWPDQPVQDEPDLLKQRRAEIGGAQLADGVNGRDLAVKTLAPLVRRAFRRSVSPEELDRYVQFYDATVQQGGSHLAGLRTALQGVLISPHFLFLAEPEPEREGIYPLADHPLAARLAIFLWSSLPDEELLDAADAGLLQKDEELQRQIHRMLQDPRSVALGENFAMQWLGLTSLGGGIRPDPQHFPEFTDDLAAAMRGETARFFAGLFSENRSLLELLDADYSYVNEDLAKLYGIPEVTGPELRKVVLTDRNRGGVLTQASVLTVSSYPLRTSPVLRGRWLLEEILGSRVPPPPPDVPALPEQPEDSKLTLREQLEIHRSNPQCASCHSRMDPLGFGLENFDPMGRWRADIAGQTIDSTGTLPSGETFNGPVELKTVLMNRKDEVLKHLSRKMYGYAIGRDLNKYDDCVIQNAVEALKKSEYRAATLVEQIVLSYQFRHRYCKK